MEQLVIKLRDHRIVAHRALAKDASDGCVAASLKRQLRDIARVWGHCSISTIHHTPVSNTADHSEYSTYINTDGTWSIAKQLLHGKLLSTPPADVATADSAVHAFAIDLQAGTFTSSSEAPVGTWSLSYLPPEWLGKFRSRGVSRLLNLYCSTAYMLGEVPITQTNVL